MVPLCRKLLDTGLLTGREHAWIDAYHAEVREKTRGYFEGDGGRDERSLAWLERETEVL